MIINEYIKAIRFNKANHLLSIAIKLMLNQSEGDVSYG